MAPNRFPVEEGSCDGSGRSPAAGPCADEATTCLHRTYGLFVNTQVSQFRSILGRCQGPPADPMPDPAPKDLVRRYYEEVVNTGAVDELGRFLSPNYTEVHENERYPLGIEGAKQHVLGVRRTYPDLHLTIDQQIAEGEWVVTRVTMTGTHSGEWLGMRPTGERVRMTAVNVDRVIDGRIVEHGGAANLLEPLLAIGAIRVVGDED